MQHSNSFSGPGLMPQIAPPDPSWRWVGERGLRVETGSATLVRYAMLAGRPFSEIEDVIPADGSLLLVLHRGAGLSAELLAALTAPLTGASPAAGTLHEIAVKYGGAAGPDLAALAQQMGMSASGMIEQHAAAEYMVAFLGFQPGFAYLNGLPPALHTPRRAVPRVSVEAGSVAIGGTYTGVYPRAGPGGWHVIGRTNVVLFDPRRDAPALLMPGDRVRFVPA